MSLIQYLAILAVIMVAALMIFLICVWDVKSNSSKPRKHNMSADQLKLFYTILETKNSWGKNEVRTLLLEIVSGIRTTV